MHFSLYLGYMRFMFSTPCLFVNKHPCFCLALLFCVYIFITYKLDGDVLNGKMGDYVEILFIFVR